jgi:hypothetical protein
MHISCENKILCPAATLPLPDCILSCYFLKKQTNKIVDEHPCKKERKKKIWLLLETKRERDNTI